MSHRNVRHPVTRWCHCVTMARQQPATDDLPSAVLLRSQLRRLTMLARLAGAAADDLHQDVVEAIAAADHASSRPQLQVVPLDA